MLVSVLSVLSVLSVSVPGPDEQAVITEMGRRDVMLSARKCRARCPFCTVWFVAALVLAVHPSPARAQDIEWLRQCGTVADDFAYGVAVDASGVYVVGHAVGTLQGQTYAGNDEWEAPPALLK